jgi:MerR family regulatory protein
MFTLGAVDGLRVSELAERAGVAASTVRFYERAGLLTPARRAANGDRMFEADPVVGGNAAWERSVAVAWHCGRLWAATALGLVSIAGSVLLVAADGVGGDVRWSHHAGASAAPLLLVAGAIAAVTVARPGKTRRAVMRFVAVLAFTAWGLAQLFPDSGAAGVLNDLAILLFVIDAGCSVITDARTLRPSARQATAQCCAAPGNACGCGDRRALPA